MLPTVLFFGIRYIVCVVYSVNLVALHVEVLLPCVVFVVDVSCACVWVRVAALYLHVSHVRIYVMFDHYCFCWGVVFWRSALDNFMGMCCTSSSAWC